MEKNESAQNRKTAGNIINPEEDQNIMLKLDCLENGIVKMGQNSVSEILQDFFFCYKLRVLYQKELIRKRIWGYYSNT